MAETGIGSRSQGEVRTKHGTVDKTENSKYLQLLRLLADILSVPSRRVDDNGGQRNGRQRQHSHEQSGS
jgi:hypothetical protein